MFWKRFFAPDPSPLIFGISWKHIRYDPYVYLNAEVMTQEL